jgi:hypothetical protein
VDDLRRGGGPQREPVPGSVTDNQAGSGFLVEPRPVFVEHRSRADLRRDHQLASVSVAGQSEWDTQLRRAVKCVWMVGEEDGEGLWIAVVENFIHVPLDGIVSSVPTDPQKLDGMSFRGHQRVFITQKIETTVNDALGEFLRTLEEIVVALDQVQAGPGIDAGHHVESLGKITDGLVDEVTGHQDEVRLQLVGDVRQFVKKFSVGELAHVGVTEVGDAESVEVGGQILDRNRDFADAETGPLRNADAGGAEGGDDGQAYCQRPQHLAAGGIRWGGIRCSGGLHSLPHAGYATEDRVECPANHARQGDERQGEQPPQQDQGIRSARDFGREFLPSQDDPDETAEDAEHTDNQRGGEGWMDFQTAQAPQCPEQPPQRDERNQQENDKNRGHAGTKLAAIRRVSISGWKGVFGRFRGGGQGGADHPHPWRDQRDTRRISFPDTCG